MINLLEQSKLIFCLREWMPEYDIWIFMIRRCSKTEVISLKKKKQEVSIIRSSTAEYLTFITATVKSDVNAVIRKFRITAADGKTYNTNHYNLRAIIAVGSLITNMSITLIRSYFLIVLINWYKTIFWASLSPDKSK